MARMYGEAERLGGGETAVPAASTSASCYDRDEGYHTIGILPEQS